MRTQKHHKEEEYLSHLQAIPNNELKSKIIKIERLIIELGMQLDKAIEILLENG